jgi:hypothetical protein
MARQSYDEAHGAPGRQEREAKVQINLSLTLSLLIPSLYDVWDNKLPNQVLSLSKAILSLT